MVGRTKFIECIMNLMDVCDRFEIGESLTEMVASIYNKYGGFDQKVLV